MIRQLTYDTLSYLFSKNVHLFLIGYASSTENDIVSTMKIVQPPPAIFIHLILVLLFSLYLGFVRTVQAQVADQDRDALIALYLATTVNGPWTHEYGFSQEVDSDPDNDVPIEDWQTSDPIEIENGRVVFINLFGNNLNGTLPEEICNMDALRELDLGVNKLEGVIPACIGDMAALTKLKINGQDMSGSLPESLLNLESLEVLNLSYNELTGGIPASLGDALANLVELNLRGNPFAGAIPASLGNLANLQKLNLGSNQLTGEIPASLGNLTNLQELWLRNNQLTGSIPASLGDLANLTLLNLSSNQLTGTIPASLGDLNLQYLYLNGNDLTDFASGAYAGWASLQAFYVDGNELRDLPDLSSSGGLTEFAAPFNYLTFADLEPIAALNPSNFFSYSPQRAVLEVHQAIENGILVFSVEEDGVATMYQWERWDLNAVQWVAIPGATKTSFTPEESGSYRCSLTNTLLPKLTIQTKAAKLEGDTIVVNSISDAEDMDVNDGVCDTGETVTGGDGQETAECTLRAAIQTTNLYDDELAPLIAFNIPGQTVPVILPGSSLPVIEQPVTIDGTTHESEAVVLLGTLAGSASGLMLRSDNSVLKGLHIKEFGGPAGIYINGDNNVVTECEIINNGAIGILVYDANDNSILENIIVDNGSDGVRVESEEDSQEFDPDDNGGDKNVINGNTIAGNGGWGVVVEGAATDIIRDDEAYQNKIANNTIGTIQKSNTEGGIRLSKLAWETSIQNNTIAYNKGLGIHIGFRSHDSIVDQCNIFENEGGGILIEDSNRNQITGNHIENNKDDGVLIIADDDDEDNDAGDKNAIIGNVISSNSGWGVFVGGVRKTDSLDERYDYASDNTIADNIIGTDATGEFARGNSSGGVLSNESRNMHIQNNTISGNEEAGVWIGRDVQATIEKNRIGTNADGMKPLGNGGNGIEICASRGTLCQSNVDILQNVISANEGNGIFWGVGQGRNSLVKGNMIGSTIHGGLDDDLLIPNRQNGITLIRVDYLTLSANIIAYNLGRGIDMKDSNKNSILNNTVTQNIKTGIFAENGEENTFRNNLISANGQGTGIHLTASDAVIEGNTLTDDAGDAITLEDGSTATITTNNIFGNAGMGLSNLTPSIMVAASENWWGDASGPGGVGPGSGDRVSEGVDFSGWRDAMVTVVVATEASETLVPIGEADTVSVFFQNWQHYDDALDVTISDTEGWLQGTSSRTVTLEGSTGAETRLALAVPAGTSNGTTSSVEVIAISQADDSHTTTTTFTLRAESAAMAQVVVLPEVVEVAPGDTVRFDAFGLDQFNRTVEFMPTWSATGGQVDANGVYIAGVITGKFMVTATDPITGFSGEALVGNGVPVAAEEADDIPNDFHLAQNYPNPFNPETTISFSLPKQAHVRLAVYDMLGREIAVLLDDSRSTGTHQTRFDASRLVSGVYFYRLVTDGFAATRTMVLLR